mmetsp:Transcript_9774/g.25647  ORF Transcript_9774/g.25647 Transcript_9774/m.25647 type:complete len:377 (+) Transcript_9774:60-1190(+)
MESYKVLVVKMLPDLPHADEAKALLEKVCWQVQPIMQRRMWKVPLVREFIPRSKNLLGLNKNMGEEICIRLRQSRQDLLFPFESILGTMLHELVHIVHGPHNAKFYALLDELIAECDNDVARGVGGSGAGFDLHGLRLSKDRHNPSSARDGRLKALEAAEKRWSKQQLMSGSGMRLGGAAPPQDRSPAEMAAEAAIRRANDDLWCHSNLEATDVPLPSSSIDSSVQRTPGERIVEQSTPLARTVGPQQRGGDAVGTALASAPHAKRRPLSDTRVWQCTTCTLINEPSRLSCDACAATRSLASERRDGKGIGAAASFSRRCPCGECLGALSNSCASKAVSCPACTYVNDGAGDCRTCAMCGSALPDSFATREVVVVD